MVIRNFQPVSINSAKKDTLSIIDAGLGAADPRLYLQKIITHNHLVMPGRKIDLAKYRRVFVIAIGKASSVMAGTVDSLTHIDGGILVAPGPVKIPSKKFKIIRAG